MQTRLFIAGVLTFGILGVASAQTPVRCIPVVGLVRLLPDATCAVTAQYPGPAYLAGIGIPGTCFSLEIRSFGLLANASGVSGLTSETAISPLTQTGAPTPLTLNEGGLTPTPNEFGMPETRQLFTGRSVITTPIGKLYTADAGVRGADSSAEELLLAQGSGAFTGATGKVFLTGNTVGRWGAFHGEVCSPRP